MMEGFYHQSFTAMRRTHLKNSVIQRDGFQLVGMTVRTNNRIEVIPEQSKIAQCAGYYWSQQVANAIQHRVTPGLTFVVYTDYESDEHGDYTYFIGEAVSSLDDQDLEQFQATMLPAGDYQRFTTAQGALPDIVIAAWREIWQLQPQDFAGKRRYLADYEIYDQRAIDPTQAEVDIYIGIDSHSV